MYSFSPAFISADSSTMSASLRTPSQTQPAGCPLCRSSNTAKLRSMDVAHVADLWRERLHIDVRREFNSVEAFELWRCKQCDLMFFVPENIAGSPDLYSQLSGFDWYSRAQKWEYEIAIKDLQGCRVVLEVGCASGNFLKLAREQL